MRIVNRYLLKEIAWPFAASLIISTFILAAGNIVQTADMIVNKGVDLSQVMKIFLYFLPYVLIFTIPISVLSAIILGFGRLSSDNEITALRTSGMSLGKMIWPVIIAGFIISLSTIPLNDKILPQSEFMARKLIRQIGIKNPGALIEPGVFIKGFKDYIIFIHSIKDNYLEDIRIYEPQKNGLTRTIVAKSGMILSSPEEESVKLRLENGTADEINTEKSEEFYKISFEEYHMTLNLDKTMEDGNINKKTREKSIKELIKDIDRVSLTGDSGIPFRIEIQKKMALSFSNLVFVIIGIPLAITTHRREKFIGFGMAIIIFLVYWGIMLTGIAMAIRSIVPPWIGVWSSNIFLSGWAFILLYRISRR